MTRKASGSGLFLTELILVIFFFSLTAAVYVQVFVRAHTVSKDSVNLTEATLIAQNFAELFYGCDADLDKIASYYPDAEVSGNTLSLYYDAYWEVYPKTYADVAIFRADVVVSDGDDGMRNAGIVVRNNDKDAEEIYSLLLIKYLPEGGTP